MLRAHLTRTRLGFVLAVAAGLLLGAVLGQPGAGRAAANAKPTPKTPPTISGAAEVGITLVASHGTWNNKPTSFHYQWVRCDATGAACLAISGATARIYTPTFSDVSHTLRVTVTAHNGSGSASASSAATAVVPPSGCPPGTGVISISSLTLPARLDVSAASVTARSDALDEHDPAPFHGHGVRRTARCSGASVFATAVPYNQFTVGQGTTGCGRHRRAHREQAQRVPGQPRTSGSWRSSSAPGSRESRRPAACRRAGSSAFHFSHHH